jgi:hypothetical protein
VPFAVARKRSAATARVTRKGLCIRAMLSPLKGRLRACGGKRLLLLLCVLLLLTTKQPRGRDASIFVVPFPNLRVLSGCSALDYAETRQDERVFRAFTKQAPGASRRQIFLHP